MNMPELSEADHQAFYGASATTPNNTRDLEETADPLDDTSQKELEQNDMNYTGVEM